MSKIVTIRFTDEEYALLMQIATKERRPISNLIKYVLFQDAAPSSPAPKTQPPSTPNESLSQ